MRRPDDAVLLTGCTDASFITFSPSALPALPADDPDNLVDLVVPDVLPAPAALLDVPVILPDSADRKAPGCPDVFVLFAAFGFLLLFRSGYLSSSSYSRLMQSTSSYISCPDLSEFSYQIQNLPQLIGIFINKTLKHCQKQNLKIQP